MIEDGRLLLRGTRNDAVIYQPRHRFLHRRKRSVARFEIEQRARFFDAAMRRMAQVVFGHCGVAFGDALFPLLPGLEAEACRLVKPNSHLLGIAAQGERGGGHNMEALTQCGFAITERQQKSARDILSVDMIEGLHAEIRKPQFGALRKCRKHFGIEVSLRIDGRPSRSDQMARMQHRYRQSGLPGLANQPRLNGSFADSVISEWLPRPFLGRRDRGARDRGPRSFRNAANGLCFPPAHLPIAARSAGNSMSGR